MSLQGVTLNPGVGGIDVATDRISSKDYQYVKPGFGLVGSFTEVSSTNPLPVTGAVTNAGTFAVQVSTAIPAGTNNIGDVDVLTLPALTTGSNTIGSIAQITTAIIPGVAATNLGKAVDNAAGSTDTGIALLAIRDDALTTLTPVDGDYANLRVTATGALWAHLDNALVGIVDDSAITLGTDSVVPAGFLADETATDSVDEGDAGIARMTLDRKVIVTDYAHAAAGGTSSYSALAAGSAVHTAAVKASPGKVFSVQVFNNTAAAKFVRLYNMTTAPASTDAASILWRGIVPASSGFIAHFPKGKQFTTGIGIRASGAIADNDTTSLAANDLAMDVDYI